MKRREPLDYYDILPEAMENYLSHYGWHFSKKACDWAVKHMRKDGKRIEMWDKEKVEKLLKNQGITLENDVLYDAVYVCNMAYADFWGSSISTEAHLALFIMDFVDDEDMPEGGIFAKWYACCMRGGTPIDWDSLL